MPTPSATSPEPYVDPPGPLAPSATFHFKSGDGCGLYGEWFLPDAPRAVALIVHGYLEHCGRYREVAHVLAQAGIASFTYDMRGHGRADGQRSYIERYEEYLDDLDAALGEVERLTSELAVDGPLPRALIGHSNGGLIALRALSDPARRPDTFDVAVLSSPFLGFKVKISAFKDTIGRLAGRWFPTLSLPSELQLEHLTSDPQKQRERQLDTLCSDVASAGWFVAVQEAHRYVLEHAGAIRLPTLWVVGGDDHIADPEAAARVSARLGQPAEYHDLAGFQHEVFNERERSRVFGLLCEFLTKQLALGAPRVDVG